MGFLICALGTSCIYYGTEQGFTGSGSDNQMREAMFDRDIPGKNLLNTDCTIYQEIAKIAEVMPAEEALRFGRMYYRQISGNQTDFGFPFGTTYTLAFSRVLYGSEVLVAYNVSEQSRQDSVVVDASIHKPGDKMNFLYPHDRGTVTVEQAPNGINFVQLNLGAHEFVILR